MDFAQEISSVADKARDKIDKIDNEETTKHALVIPFIKALGYDVYDPEVVRPEFTADFAEKKGEKVDYALLYEDEPAILIECKPAGRDLSSDHAEQLFRYFQFTEAGFGVLTNGVKYRFFSDLEEENKMDQGPFLTLDLLGYSDQELEAIKMLRRSSFDPEQMREAAHNLKYRKGLRRYLEDQWERPGEEFVRFMTDRVYDGRITQNVREQFRPIVREALQQLVHDKVRGRLSSALQEEEQSAAEDLSPESDEPDDEELPEGVVRKEGDIVTLRDEIEGFRIVKAILRSEVDVDRIAQRDLKTYFNVLLDDNNRKPICRFYFHSDTKRLGLIDEEKEETRVQIDSLDEIYEYAEHLKETVRYYIQSDV